MLDVVAKGFRAAKHKLTGKAELTEENIDEALREIRVSLLEADVEFGVVKKFIADVKEKALGEVVSVKATARGGRLLQAGPGDHFIKICHDELEALMGPVDTSLRFKSGAGPTVIMMVGLQGSGKTTTTGKLASYLGRKGRKPLLVAADIYRPAAVQQLKVLGEKLKVPVHSVEGASPLALCQGGIEAARRLGRDVVVLDTAGRLAIDEEMMQELEAIRFHCTPDNTLLVVDAMVGQDAVRTAAEFDRRLTIDGFVMTKLDGDARGGAALSIKQVTGKPIKFLGTGEKMDRLEEFRPDGLAGRILGFGDVVGLMKEFEEVVDKDRAEADAEKLLSGNFNIEDFVNQIRTIRKMGPLSELLEKFPLFGELPAGVKFDDSELTKIEAMVGSMTTQEKRNPALINASRVRRIARGSGRQPAEVQALLQRFLMMRKMMGQLGQAPGLLGKLPGFKQLAQLQKLRGMDMNALMGEMMSGGGMPGMPGMGGFPGMGGLPGMAGMGGRGFPGFGSGAPALSDAERRKIEERRKKEKANKKKNRKK